MGKHRIVLPKSEPDVILGHPNSTLPFGESCSQLRRGPSPAATAPDPPISGRVNGPPKTASAFTLIELVVVMVLLAIFASLAVVSFGGTMDRYKMVQAFETMETFDSQARREARKTQQPLEATINSGRRELQISATGRTFRLPSRVEITNIRFQRGKRGGIVRLPIASDGSSPTYAVELTRGNMKRWFVVLGVSGQVVPMQNEGELNALFAL